MYPESSMIYMLVNVLYFRFYKIFRKKLILNTSLKKYTFMQLSRTPVDASGITEAPSYLVLFCR